MSFAPNKNSRYLNSSLDKRSNTAMSLTQSRTFLSKNPQNRSNLGLIEIAPEPPLVRLDRIESNLTKICNQNEILLPLLNMTSSLPIFSKTESDLKEMQKKIVENERSLMYFEEGLEKYKEYFEDSKYRMEMISEEKAVDELQIERQIKITNNHLNALHSNLKDVENTVHNLQTLLDKKFNEETKVIKESVETKLKKSKKEIQNTLKESEIRINQVFKEHEENLKKYNLFKVFIFSSFALSLIIFRLPIKRLMIGKN